MTRRGMSRQSNKLLLSLYGRRAVRHGLYSSNRLVFLYGVMLGIAPLAACMQPEVGPMRPVVEYSLLLFVPKRNVSMRIKNINAYTI